MIEITSREQFEALLGCETTLLVYGGKKCSACKQQIDIIDAMRLNIPAYYADIESPGMIGYIGTIIKNGLPIIAVFKDRSVKRTWQKGLTMPAQIRALIGD